MDRRTKGIVGAIGITVLLAILASTTMGATAEFVTPTDLAETDSPDNELVKLEGRVVDLQSDDEITFDVADRNHTVAVTYDGTMPETMAEGRLVVAEGYYDGNQMEAESLTVRAHEGERPEESSHNGTYTGSYNGSDTGTYDGTETATETPTPPS